MKFKNLVVLIRNLQIRTFEKGEIIIPLRSERADLFYVRKGLIRSFRESENPDEEETTFQLFPEHHISGNLHAIFLDEPSKFSYQALERSKVYLIDFTTFNQEASKNPELGMFSRQFVGKRIVKQAFHRIESFVFLSPEERYIKYIKDNPNLINRAPDKYIASVLGITPTSLSRIRKRLASKKA